MPMQAKHGARNLPIAGVIFLLSLDVIFFFLDLSPSGIKLDAPLSGRDFPNRFLVEGHAWHNNSSSNHTVTIVAENSAGNKLTKQAPRVAVKDRNKILFLLNYFHTFLDLKENGPWKVTAVLKDESGKTILKKTSNITIKSGIPGRDFQSFSMEHLVPASVVLLACVAIAFFFRKERSLKTKAITELFIVLALFTNETIYHIYWYVSDGWVPSASLLVQMCGLSILMLIAVFYIDSEKSRNLMFDLIFFWGLGGALQAILAPDIGARGYPDFKYFSFFISHGFIMIGATYIIAGRGYRPTFKSLVRVAIITNIFVFLSYWFNILLEKLPPYERGNYFITGYPPPTGSVVDVFAKIFGPSPRYIIGLEIMGLAVFVVLWAPFAIARLRAVKTQVKTQQSVSL